MVADDDSGDMMTGPDDESLWREMPSSSSFTFHGFYHSIDPSTGNLIEDTEDPSSASSSLSPSRMRYNYYYSNYEDAIDASAALPASLSMREAETTTINESPQEPISHPWAVALSSWIRWAVRTNSREETTAQASVWVAALLTAVAVVGFHYRDSIRQFYEYHRDDQSPIYTVQNILVSVVEVLYSLYQRYLETPFWQLWEGLAQTIQQGRRRWRPPAALTVLSLFWTGGGTLFVPLEMPDLADVDEDGADVADAVVVRDGKNNNDNDDGKRNDPNSLEPAFLNPEDYPKDWLVYHPALGVVLKTVADAYNKNRSKQQKQFQSRSSPLLSEVHGSRHEEERIVNAPDEESILSQSAVDTGSPPKIGATPRSRRGGDNL